MNNLRDVALCTECHRDRKRTGTDYAMVCSLRCSTARAMRLWKHPWKWARLTSAEIPAAEWRQIAYAPAGRP